MNYGLALSLRLERCLERLAEGGAVGTEGGTGEMRERKALPQDRESEPVFAPGVGAAGGLGSDDRDDLEERALGMAMEEVYETSGQRDRPWGGNGRAIRMGELVLLVDSDTIVPEDCLRDAAREMAECPRVAILQHSSGEFGVWRWGDARG